MKNIKEVSLELLGISTIAVVISMSLITLIFKFGEVRAELHRRKILEISCSAKMKKCFYWERRENDQQIDIHWFD